MYMLWICIFKRVYTMDLLVQACMCYGSVSSNVVCGMIGSLRVNSGILLYFLSYSASVIPIQTVREVLPHFQICDLEL